MPSPFDDIEAEVQEWIKEIEERPIHSSIYTDRHSPSDPPSPPAVRIDTTTVVSTSFNPQQPRINWVEQPPPIEEGACCLPDGTCKKETKAKCNTDGGKFAGVGVPCDPPPCGACCFHDESCVFETEDQCNTDGGTFKGTGTHCDDVGICAPTGACCLPDQCFIFSASDCADFAGVYQGDNTTCSPDPCKGACCNEGFCDEVHELVCVNRGGTWLGLHTTCSPDPCPGICCASDGTCSIKTSGDCAASGGTFLGSGNCGPPNPCPSLGACCTIDGMCNLESSSACTLAGGTYQGDGTTCSPDPCGAGACCHRTSFDICNFSPGSCSSVPLAACVGPGRTFMGAGTLCDPLGHGCSICQQLMPLSTCYQCSGGFISCSSATNAYECCIAGLGNVVCTNLGSGCIEPTTCGATVGCEFIGGSCSNELVSDCLCDPATAFAACGGC